jgi:hypothetical protein
MKIAVVGKIRDIKKESAHQIQFSLIYEGLKSAQ